MYRSRAWGRLLILASEVDRNGSDQKRWPHLKQVFRIIVILDIDIALDYLFQDHIEIRHPALMSLDLLENARPAFQREDLEIELAER